MAKDEDKYELGAVARVLTEELLQELQAAPDDAAREVILGRAMSGSERPDTGTVCV